MRRIIFMFMIAVSAACTTSCSQKVVLVPGTSGSQSILTAGQKTLLIPGTGDSQDILRDLAAAYEQSHPGTAIVIPDSTGSFATTPNTLGGLESAGTRTTILGRTAVRPREEDLKRFGPMYYREFARGPVAFVVHNSVPLRQLTSQELCDIYAGHITNWQHLGGPDLRLVVQTRPEGSNMLAIRQAIGCFKDLHVTDTGHLNLRNADAVASLRDMPGSIGFMPLGEAQSHGLPVLKLDGREPLLKTYPVTISLGLVHMDPLTGLAKDFTDFLATDEAARLLRQSGHIPVAAPSELVELSRKNPEPRRLSHTLNQYQKNIKNSQPSADRRDIG